MIFNFRSSKFRLENLSNALALANLSLLAYSDKLFVERRLRRNFGALKARFIKYSETQCFIAHFNGGIILSFRGTEPLIIGDWLTNINVTKISGPWGKRVHRGFHSALNGVWDEINLTLKEFQPSLITPLWITGHSLGGALAVLAAARFNSEKRHVKGVMTFGQPRMGDKAFVKTYNEHIPNTIRFVNNEDIVTRVPKFKYDHVGDKCYFASDKKAYLNPSKYFMYIDYLNEINFRSINISRRFLGQHPNSIADHSMLQYISCIKANTSNRQDPRPHSAFLEFMNQ